MTIIYVFSGMITFLYALNVLIYAKFKDDFYSGKDNSFFRMIRKKGMEPLQYMTFYSRMILFASLTVMALSFITVLRS